MPNAKIVAPANPRTERTRRIAELKDLGAERTDAETNELISLLEAEISDPSTNTDTDTNPSGG